jgi:hypothetical protein
VSNSKKPTNEAPGEVFDLDQFSSKQSHKTAPSEPAKSRKWQRRFVMFPWEWVRRLNAARYVYNNTWRLAVLLCYEHWRAGGQPIVLSNILAADVGLSRFAKTRALRRLEKLELIEIIRCPGKAPRINPQYMKGD